MSKKDIRCVKGVVRLRVQQLLKSEIEQEIPFRETRSLLVKIKEKRKKICYNLPFYQQINTYM